MFASILSINFGYKLKSHSIIRNAFVFWENKIKGISTTELTSVAIRRNSALFLEFQNVIKFVADVREGQPLNKGKPAELLDLV